MYHQLMTDIHCSICDSTEYETVHRKTESFKRCLLCGHIGDQTKITTSSDTNSISWHYTQRQTF